MSDIPSKTVERYGITFGKLSARDRAGIIAKQKAARRLDLAANLDAAGIDGEEKLAELEAFDLTPRGLQDFIDHVNSLEGQADIVLCGLRKVKADATDDDVMIPAGDTFALAAEIAGLNLVPVKAAEAEGDEPPRPSEDVYSPQT